MVARPKTSLLRRAFGLMLGAQLLPACLDLPKVPTGPRVVDNFETADLRPSWTRFGTWTCGTFAGSDQAAGLDSGAPEDQGVDCQGTAPGDGDMYSLSAVFTLDAPLDGRPQEGVSVVTRTIEGTVDLTGFTLFTFEAFVEAVPPAPLVPLPPGTQFNVELGCSAIATDPLAVWQVPAGGFEANSWIPSPFQAPLAEFRSQSCLVQVDSVHFTIVAPTLATGMSTGGTLHIDNIVLR